MIHDAAARLQRLQGLLRLCTLRHARAERSRLAAWRDELAAQAELARIAARIDALRGEETSCARRARELVSLAALQAAHQRGAQLRCEADAQQPSRLAAEQRWQRLRVERERAARRERAEQIRRDRLDHECRLAQARMRSAHRLAETDAALDVAIASHARARAALA